jgi:tRNA(Ile2) C34 agmatinyltransferase TiaS
MHKTTVTWHGIELPSMIAHRVASVESRGHTLVSQGCAMFRCTRCDTRGFLDETSFTFPRECKKGNG